MNRGRNMPPPPGGGNNGHNCGRMAPPPPPPPGRGNGGHNSGRMAPPPPPGRGNGGYGRYDNGYRDSYHEPRGNYNGRGPMPPSRRDQYGRMIGNGEPPPPPPGRTNRMPYAARNSGCCLGCAIQMLGILAAAAAGIAMVISMLI